MCVFFFFKAEAGIRDLVRSRGLGDVYKRQKKTLAPTQAPAPVADEIVSKANSAVRTETARPLVIVRVTRAVLRNGPSVEATAVQTLDPVSYTHLTLPTRDLV